MNTDPQQVVAAWLTKRGIPAPPPGDAEVSRPELAPEDTAGSTPTGKDPEADPYTVARTIALRKLTVQARTRHELDQTLRAKQVPEQVGRDVLDRLADVGLVDDAALEPVDADAELASALDLATRKLRQLADLAPEVRYRRLAGLLSRRGFGPGTTSRVLTAVLGED